MYQRTLELFYDQLVIGSDLSALSYCYINKCPAIYLSIDKPYKYGPNDNWEEDMALWCDLAYMLSNDKYIPFSDKIVSIRLENENTLKVTSKLGLVTTINFDKLVISNDKNIEGLPPVTSKTNYNNWVIDWFDVKIGMTHDLDFIEDKNDQFVQKVYFYKSERMLYKTNKKDLLSVSVINDENLKSDDYNENIARLKILKMMQNAGIKGNWDKTNNYFVKPRISSVKRDIYPLGKNIYNDLPSNISILYDEPESLLLESEYDEKWYDLVESRYIWSR